MSAATGRVVDWALDVEPLNPPEVARGEIAYLLLRHRGRPVGRLVVEGGRGPAGRALVAAAREAAAPGMAAAEAEARIARTSRAQTPGSISVVVATRNRPDDLRAALGALRALDPPPGEIVVVDSASDDPRAIAAIAEKAGARLLRCDRPGLSLARNAGAAAARGAIVAFLDDDCRVDPGWLGAIARGFEDPGVHAVTGSYAPSELATRAQILFLRYAHMDRRGATAARFSRTSSPSKHWPLDAWRMGSGGNIAVRAEAFRAQGGFRTDLGLGTPALGGEDLCFLWSTVRDGGDVVYRADAMAWHRHHRDLAALRRVMFGYGAGHAAYLRAAVVAGAPPGAARFYEASVAYDRVKRFVAALVAGEPAVAGLVLREAWGMVRGRSLGRRAADEQAVAGKARSTSANTRP